MAIIPNDVETLPINFNRLEQGARTLQTDRRQTDGRRHYSERKREFTFVKCITPSTYHNDD